MTFALESIAVVSALALFILAMHVVGALGGFAVETIMRLYQRIRAARLAEK